MEEGPPEDREMDLRDHLEELRSRLVRIIVAVGAATVIIFYFSGTLLDKFWRSLFGPTPPYVLSPLEWLLTELSFSLTLALIILYPYIIFELYRFAKPGLYEHERKFLRNLIIPSYILFVFGLFIAYKFIVPEIYNLAKVSTASPYFSVGRAVGNAIKLLMSFALFLQIPLAMLLAERFGIVDYSTFKTMRIPLYIIVFLFFTNATANFAGLTQIVSMALFIVMYELGLLLLKVSIKIKPKESKQTG